MNNGVNIPKKELFYFGKFKGQPSRAEYLSILPAASPSGWVGEFTPNYAHMPGAIGQMSEIVPEARIIFSYRNPIDRAKSAYMHALGAGLIPNQSFESTILNARMGSANNWEKSILQLGQYEKLIPRIENYFPSSQLLLLSFDSIISNSGHQHSILDFLGIDDGVPEKLPKTNTWMKYNFDRPSTALSESTLDFLFEYYEPTRLFIESRFNRSWDWQ